MNGKYVDITNQRPKPASPVDAATLLLVNFNNKSPTVLMGKRHSRHSFMPDKYVFPGGKVDQCDRKINVAGALHPIVEERLMKQTRSPSPIKARSFALAAIRETFEETGIMLGTIFADGHISADRWRSLYRASSYATLLSKTI